MTEMTLDTMDKRILDIIQTDFPLESRPYAIIAERLGITEQEALDRVNALRKSRLIRGLGPTSSRPNSVSCPRRAAKVPGGQVDAFIAEVNRHVGVTHNYLRRHAYNVWFSPQSAPRGGRVRHASDDITAKTGIPILNLPATKLYKIHVDFRWKRNEWEGGEKLSRKFLPPFPGPPSSLFKDF